MSKAKGDVAVAVFAAVVLAGCTTSAGHQPAADPGASPGAPSFTRGVTATTTGENLPPVRRPDTLPALMHQTWESSPISIGDVLERTDAYTRYAITYGSGGREISGMLLRPHGDGPFPAIVLNHGFVPPSEYVSGDGMEREHDYLARAGFVVLHTDYRGHAESEAGPGMDTRVGYAEDSINAVLALEQEPYVDPDRMAMLGRSMGGGVTLNALVAFPDLVEAAVIFGSVSSSLLENMRHFTLPERPEALRAMFAKYGEPKYDRSAYHDMSPRSYFERVSDPVLIHHGTIDRTCPFEWASDTHRLLQEAGADVELARYEGEGHTFYAQWERSMERTVRFIRAAF